ncbi:hypothetical protein CORC01_12826 [Colletotrichum orchidophilum]|uniref:Uncharacterized protein n=1 Tax=Colletotrichum orchidophilum TaxID=1209926 RepID=A0A1G4AS14_9PEZI|nr:uncharacterized protein CORC01_12826 [Colletotrichum orchidophilum]OHE91873.1 hypothetical protein CORC01_12826 [Colletotrichum orchidophilum]
MRFLTTITLAALTAGVTAVPIALLPSLTHPPVHVFKADAAPEAINAEPDIEARGDRVINVSDWEREPEILARDDAAIDAFGLEPETQAGEASRIQARDEAALDNIDLEPEIEARDERRIKARDEVALDNYDLKPEVQASDSPQIKARDELTLENVDLEPTIHARDERHIQARSEAAVQGVTPEEDWKYRDNLAKLDANNCGTDCHNSLDSYRSKVSRERRDYYDRSTSPSSRASRDEHNTPEDKVKYIDNLIKQDNRDCGTGCKDSLASYRSVASKDSKLSREKDLNDRRNDNFILPNTYYPRDSRPKDFTASGNGKNVQNYNNGNRDFNGVTRSSRASRGEHNSLQDVAKHDENHKKLAEGDCGVNCHKSLDSYHSVASADSKRSKASKESREARQSRNSGRNGGW